MLDVHLCGEESEVRLAVIYTFAKAWVIARMERIKTQTTIKIFRCACAYKNERKNVRTCSPYIDMTLTETCSFVTSK
jgi:hypothetical protein